MADEVVTATATVTAKESFAEKVEHGVEVAGKDVVKVVTFGLTEGAKLVKVIETAEKLTPQFKADLQVLVDDVKPIAIALAPALAAEGENIPVDIAALVAVAPQLMKLVKDFLSFVPAVESAFGTIASDLS